MSNGVFYGMVTVKSSSNYTESALDTFFKYTKFNANDQFVLIDNDGDWIENHHKDAFSKDNVIVNTIPKNTSSNINQLIQLASQSKQDLVFLSNDVLFTPEWNTRLIDDDNVISIPSCNQTHDYEIPAALSLIDFKNNQSRLNAIAHLHNLRVKSPYTRLLMPTYVCKIPYKVYTEVGYFDEDFNVGGEDVDYRIRCLKSGFSVKYCKSFLLHFNGKSSWNGAETSSDTAERNQKYSEKFIEKYNIDLYNLCIASGDVGATVEKYNLHELMLSKKFDEAILKVLNNA